MRQEWGANAVNLTEISKRSNSELSIGTNLTQTSGLIERDGG